MNDAQPGKILHEMRSGEMAALREVPFGLYYGSVDATPLFVMLAGLYARRTGDDATIAELWPAIEAALAWIDGPADQDGDGFVEYFRATEQGLANQGWEGDSFERDLPRRREARRRPIALAEVQGYVYAAKRLAARCARRMGREERAWALDSQAARLADAFEAAFWCPDLGTYAIALDGAKRPLPGAAARTPGQVLFTGICAPERAAEIAHDLMRPHFFSGWGIRTIAQGEARYNPMSYHNGSVWPARQRAGSRSGLPGTTRSAPSSRSSKACSTRRPTWICAACPSCSAASCAPARAAGRRSAPGRVRAAGLGERDAVTP